MSQNLVKHKALLKTPTHHYTDLYKLKLWVLLAGDVPVTEIQDRCPLSVICAVTCPSQCRHKTRTDPVEQGSSCVLGPRSERSKLWLTCQPIPPRWMCLPQPSRDLCGLPQEMASPWGQQVLEIATPPAPFWHTFCRHRHEMVSLHGIHWPSKAERNLVTVTIN